ncbi:MAG TPA: BA14K family protein [Croceibacterium sp.]|nr:BA14K family protein [Croceibacterium sp.]
MRKYLATALAAASLTLAPTIGSAQSQRPQAERTERPAQNNTSQNRPAQQQNQGTSQQNRQNNQQGQSSRGQYGEWRSSWGSTPPAPPQHWTKKSDWYRHVRACQQRYKSYNARTDAYRAYSGRTVRCSL